MDIYNFNDIKKLAIEPTQKEEFEQWILQKDHINFLETDVLDEYITIFASLPFTFINTILIPTKNLDEYSTDKLMHWNIDLSPSWSVVHNSEHVWLENTFEENELFKNGEKILYSRSFEGSKQQRTYYELNQKIAHLTDLHFISERKSWCKLDEHGNIDEVIKIIEIDEFSSGNNIIVVMKKKDAFSEFTGIADLQLFRMFDFTLYKSGNFHGWQHTSKEREFGNSNSIFGTLTVEPDNGSWSRGYQIIDIRKPPKEIVDDFWGRSEAEDTKEYCTFLAQDWKNKRLEEISCNPACLANYFTESDLPFEITPAFFKPEVLLKYKSDYERYRLGSRFISCRGSWDLKTFDINTAGQVHTYLIYLSRLPYEEQLHWKQFNEKPKAPLSERAIKTDFEGEFYSEYDSLLSLKKKLSELDEIGCNWWKLRDEHAPDKVHYPYTDSRDEWANEILNLDQLLIEGLEEKWLRRKAKELGCNPNARLRALKLTEELLVALKFEADHAHEILTPFHVVHTLRSLLKGHTVGTEAENSRKEAIRDYGSFKNHFEKICADCDESLGIIIEAFDELK